MYPISYPVSLPDAGQGRPTVTTDPDLPPWFRDAIAAPSTTHRVQMDGCSLSYRTWGDRGRPGLLLVHGGGAHNHWWDFIAPLLSDRYFVVAQDLSGHGESGRRTDYPRRVFARELLAVIDDVGFADKPAVVGHSMGGLITIVAAAVYGDRFANAIIVDAPVRSRDSDAARQKRGQAFRNPKVYPDRQTAIDKYRLVPAQPCDNDFIVRHVAAHSLMPVEGGFTWKFDPKVFTGVSVEPMNEHLQHPKCPIALINGALSVVVPPEMVTFMKSLVPEGTPVLSLPGAHHHVLLDQPQPFVAMVRQLLDGFGY